MSGFDKRASLIAREKNLRRRVSLTAFQCRAFHLILTARMIERVDPDDSSELTCEITGIDLLLA
jgi:hypothetical protein